MNYISSYWEKIKFNHPHDKGKHLGLPNSFISPNNEIFRKDQFYWDSYFVILGLVDAGKIKLAKGMVENFIYLLNRFSIIPMRNRYYNLGTSQPPFLTSMAFEIFQVDKDLDWLIEVMKAAEKEMQKYWMNDKLTEKHITPEHLSRYCDHYITHLGAEHESGWDMTSRFHDRCLDYLPVDLNTLLYKYETDISKAYILAGKRKSAEKYRQKAEQRQQKINELMWDEKSCFFLDYNFKTHEPNHFKSVAGFYPLWAQLASAEQAALIVQKTLPEFEFEGGITNTQTKGLSPDRKQHDHPNGWPHQQWIVIRGLLNYGYKTEAERLAMKWVDMNARVFKETGKFWEKYNVVSCDVSVENSDRYILQSGFGWTNAVFLRLVNEFGF